MNNKKNVKRSFKGINNPFNGYALYDTDLNEKYFIESLNEVISLHDVFVHEFKNKKPVLGEVKYKFDKVNYLDQVSLMNALPVKETVLKSPAEFTLVYFNNNLRGYKFRFNRALFDERSVKKVLQAIEKQYFKGKYKQTSTSYSKWLQDNQVDFSKAFKTGQYQVKDRVLNLDEQLTKRIREYLKKNDLTLFQFVTGIVGTYFKVSKKKDLTFSTNYFTSEDFALVGRMESNLSYQLNKNPNVSLSKFVSSDLKEKNFSVDIEINVKDHFADLKGNIIIMHPSESQLQLEILIDEKDWEIDLQFIYQKYKYKNDDIYLMMNKMKLAIFALLETEDKLVSDLSLMTRKEEQIALSMIEPIEKTTKGIYESFVDARLKNAEKIAIQSNGQSITFTKLSDMVSKMSKVLEKSNAGIISINAKNDFEMVAAFLAADHMNCAYDFNNNHQIIKKGLLGYKVTGTAVKSSEQYIIDHYSISKKGYQNYCSWFKYNFKANNETKTLVRENIIDLGIPSLIAGATIVFADVSDIDKEGITLARLTMEELKSFSSLKDAIVDGKKSNEKVNYNIHFGQKFDMCVPYAMTAKFNHGRINKLTPVNGIGILLLDKNFNLTEAYQRSNIYTLGSGVAEANKIKIDVKGHQVFAVKQENTGSWFMDETIRL